MSSPTKKNDPSALIEKLCKAREEAYRYATIQLARGDRNLMQGNFITREEVDAELKNVAKKLAELGY